MNLSSHGRVRAVRSLAVFSAVAIWHSTTQAAVPAEGASTGQDQLLLAMTPDRAFVQAGDGANVRSANLGLVWERREGWQVMGADLKFYTEATIGRWWVEGQTATDRSTHAQFGITPTLRLNFAGEAGFFLEGGIGFNVISPLYSRGNKRFSTTFNFGDHIGLGIRPASWRGAELALRVQHFSNAGIKHPNPGENFLQLRFSRGF